MSQNSKIMKRWTDGTTQTSSAVKHSTSQRLQTGVLQIPPSLNMCCLLQCLTFFNKLPAFLHWKFSYKSPHSPEEWDIAHCFLPSHRQHLARAQQRDAHSQACDSPPSLHHLFVLPALPQQASEKCHKQSEKTKGALGAHVCNTSNKKLISIIYK